MVALFYPAAVYFALDWLEPRVIAAVLAAVLLWRLRGRAARLLSGLSGAARAVVVALLALCLAALVANDEMLLRLYPAALNLGLLSLFGLSLRQPPSMVERFARLRHPKLPAEAVRYTRQVTQAWCMFFLVNGIVAAWTAMSASREMWLLYNGLVAYLIMGAFFAGEWLVRRYRFPEAR